MKQYENVKKEINECTSAIEMAGYVDGLNAAAIIYCKQNYPNEVYTIEGSESKVTICRMTNFLGREL